MAADDDVPKLPRGRGLRLSRVQLVRIAGMAVLLAFVLVMTRPCATSVSKFVTSFGDQGSASAVMPRPDNVDMPAGSAASGSAATGSAAIGSASGPAAGAGSDGALEQFEHLKPGMSEDEIKAAIERARAKARATGTP